MKSITSLVNIVAGGALAAGLFGIAPQYASADLYGCKSKDGTVRVYDRERSACGWLSYDNPDWTKIGNPPWNDRMDDYGNDDWTKGRTMCLYKDIKYKSLLVRLRPGYAWTNIPNAVSSNKWSC
jgi:hypothetical protein